MFVGFPRLRAADLAERLAHDKAQGLVPCVLQLNHGTTNTSSHDPVAEFASLAADHGLWLHVDAAYAGASWLLPSQQQHARAVAEAATSFNFNGSKWFLCGFDSAFLWARPD